MRLSGTIALPDYFLESVQTKFSNNEALRDAVTVGNFQAVDDAVHEMKVNSDRELSRMLPKILLSLAEGMSTGNALGEKTIGFLDHAVSVNALHEQWIALKNDRLQAGRQPNGNKLAGDAAGVSGGPSH